MRQTHLRGWPRLDEWVPGTFKRTLCLLMEHFLLRCLHFLLSATVCVFPNALHFFFVSAFQTVKAIEQFGGVIEELLIKHGKKIIGERVCVCDCGCFSSPGRFELDYIMSYF